MKTKLIASAILIMTITSVPVFSQDYNVGLGLRLGVYTSGFTVKGFVGSRGALEGIASFGNRSFVTTGLYEYHIPIPKAPGLNLYLGGGGHVGFFGHDSKYHRHHHDDVYDINDGNTAVIPGIDFIFGAEYKFKDVPITVGSDIKPFVDFYDGPSHYIDGSLHVRYVF